MDLRFVVVVGVVALLTLGSLVSAYALARRDAALASRLHEALIHAFVLGAGALIGLLGAKGL